MCLAAAQQISHPHTLTGACSDLSLLLPQTVASLCEPAVMHYCLCLAEQPSGGALAVSAPEVRGNAVLLPIGGPATEPCSASAEPWSPEHKLLPQSRASQISPTATSGVMEIWWDSSRGWSTVMAGYHLFRKGQGKQGGVAVHIKVMSTSSEGQYKVEAQPVESPWAKVGGEQQWGCHGGNMP